MRNLWKISSYSIKTKLLLLLMIVVLPASGIIIISDLEHHRHKIEDARKNVLLLVESLAAQQEQMVAGTKQMLSTLAHLPEVQTLDVKSCKNVFRELCKQNPFYSTMVLATPDGDIVAAFPEITPGGINIAERFHIKEVRATLDFSAGEYVVGKHTSIGTIHYGYPVLDENRNLLAIVGIGFDLSKYARFIEKASLHEGSAVVILDRRGVRLYRSPVNELSAIGKKVPSAAFKEVSGEVREGLFETSGSDGIYRIYGFKQLRLREDLPPYIYMIVGIPKDPIVEQARQGLLRSLALLAGITAALMVLGYFFGNRLLTDPFRELVRATKRLAEGEMGVSTGLPHTTDELGQLARSFDEMSSLLKARSIERDESEEALWAVAQRLQLAIKSGNLGVWDWDISSDVLTWNDKMFEIYGNSKKSFTGCLDTWRSFLHAEDSTKTLEAVQAAIRGEREYDTEFRILRPDGSVRVLKANGLVIRDTEDKPLRMIGLNRDITEQRQAEEMVAMQRDIGLALGSATHLEDALRVLLCTAMGIEGLDCGGVYLVDGATGELNLICHEGLSPSFVKCVSHYGPGFPETDFAMLGEPAYWSSLENPLNMGDTLEKEGIKALASVPVKWEGQVVALLNLASHSQDTIPFLARSAVEAIAGRIGGIVARVRMQDALFESERRYRELVQNANSAIIRWKRDGTITFFNEYAQEFFGWSEADVIGKNLSILMPGQESTGVHLTGLLQDIVDHPEHYESNINKNICRDGRKVWMSWTNRAIRDEHGQVKEILAIGSDITERKRAEEALRKSEGELRFLSSRLLSAQEEERKRIARELHDGLSGSLTALKMSLENARGRLELCSADPGLLEIPISWTQHMIDEARRLMTELRPSVLDDIGVIAALEWFLRQFRTTFPGIHVEKEIGIEEVDIPEPLKITIFRITQEAFHNMAKYSSAEFASLSIAQSDSAIELVIEDNGKGFSMETVLTETSERQGLGLTSMKERCELSGGSFQIFSNIGEGTLIRASWPISRST